MYTHNMVHFRNLVALVCLEFIAQVLGKQISEVDARDFMWYSVTMRKTILSCNGTRDTVKCIMYLYFNRQTRENTNRCRFSNQMDHQSFAIRKCNYSPEFKFQIFYTFFTSPPNDSFSYNIKRDGWKTRSNNSVFDPHEQTLREMDNVYERFNFPENPLSNAPPP